MSSQVTLLPKAKIAGMIKMVGATKSKLFALIDDAAIQCQLHAHKHGDLTLMQSLINETVGTKYEQTLKVWAGNFLPVKVMTDKAGHVTSMTMQDGWQKSPKWNKLVEQPAENAPADAKPVVVSPSVLEERRRIKATERSTANAAGQTPVNTAPTFTTFERAVKIVIADVEKRGADIRPDHRALCAEYIADLKALNLKYEARALKVNKAAAAPSIKDVVKAGKQKIAA